MNIDLNALSEQDLDFYIGKTIREYMQAKVIFEKAQSRHSDLNSFLENKFQNAKSLDGNLDIFLKKMQDANELKNKICEFANEIGVENFQTKDLPLSLQLDKETRAQRTLELTKNGQTGVIKRSIEVRDE